MKKFKASNVIVVVCGAAVAAVALIVMETLTGADDGKAFNESREAPYQTGGARTVEVKVREDNTAVAGGFSREKLELLLGLENPTDSEADELFDLVSRWSAERPLSEVLSQLKEILGEGSDLARLLYVVFENTRESPDVVREEMGKLPNALAGVALMGYLHSVFGVSLSAETVNEVFGWDITADPAGRNAVESAFNLELAQCQNPAERAASLLLMVDGMDAPRAEQFATALMAALVRADPHEAWKMLNTAAPVSVISDGPRGALRDQAVAGILSHGSEAGVEFLVEQGGSTDDFSRAGLIWANGSAVKAERFLEEKMSMLPVAGRQGLMSGFALRALGADDLSTYEIWRQQALDVSGVGNYPELLRNGERSHIRAMASKDPTATVQGLIDNSLPFDAHWLEEAMITWVRQDFESSEAWYRENSATLRPADEQYVAAAYARDAIAKGELEIARQWVARVSEPATLNRLQGYLRNAEDTGGE